MFNGRFYHFVDRGIPNSFSNSIHMTIRKNYCCDLDEVSGDVIVFLTYDIHSKLSPTYLIFIVFIN